MGKLFARMIGWLKKARPREQRGGPPADHEEATAEPNASRNHTNEEHQEPSGHRESSEPKEPRGPQADEQEFASASPPQHGATPTTGPKKREKYGLFPLRTDQQLDTCEVDIVAVHGLGGDWRDTWKHSNPYPHGTLWLEDFLPREFPGARIWSFGYDAGVLSRSVGDIDDAAKSLVNSLNGRRQRTGSNSKPIVFIAHSLGGIIVKRALILVNERSDYWKDIATSTVGAMFFGVPHRGADKAYWAALAVRLVRISSLGTIGNNKFLDSLKRNSIEFSKVSEAFTQPAARLQKIKSFYEMRPIGNDVVVDKDSATIGTNNELSIPIMGADHREMCKFESMDSSQYQDVMMALCDIIGGTSGDAASTVKMQVDKYLRLDLESKMQKEPNEAAPEEHEWIFHMTPFGIWMDTSKVFLLQVQYDTSLDWLTCVSEAICGYMVNVGHRPYWTICMSDLECSGPEDWKCLVPRLLLAHIFSFSGECLQKMAKAIQAARSDGILRVILNGPKTTCDIRWERSFCSETSAWEEQWILLNCALQCLGQDVLLVLTGLETQHFEQLDDCLHYLDPDICFDGLNLRSSGGLAIRPKMLIVGKGSDDKCKHTVTSTWFERFKLNVTVEADTCLSSLYFPALHARRDRVGHSEENTSKWIWNNPTYKAWFKLESGLIWIFGKAGSGKSTLAAYMQRSLAKDTHGSILVDFFYSARGGQTESGHVHMLRSILYQILKEERSLYPAYQRHFRRSRCRDLCQWTFQDLKRCLLDIQLAKEWKHEQIKKTFILMVDGLDESEDDNSSGISRREALQVFPQLCQPNGNHTFKVIALSRDEALIKSYIEPPWSLDMKEVNEGDIEKIVDAGIKTLWQNIRSAGLAYFSSDSPPLAYEKDKKFNRLELIREYLIKHADGVILWVVLVLRGLGQRLKDPSCTPAEISEAIAEIPENLEKVYQDMFDRLRSIPFRNPKKAGHLFTWLLHCESTLKVCEIRDVVAMFSWPKNGGPTYEHQTLDEHRPFQHKGDWQRTKELLDNLCGGFVEIIPQQRRPSDIIPSEYQVNPGDSVQLIHQTAREFLLDPMSELNTTGTLRTLDDVCLDCVYYTELAFRNPLPDGPAYEVLNSMVNRLQDSPLLGYILHTFPRALGIQIQAESDHGRIMRRRIAEFADSAEQDHWSSVTWWFLRPWIERLFPNGTYRMEDPTRDNLRLVLEPEIVKSTLIRHIIRVGFRDDHVTQSTVTREGIGTTLGTDITVIRDLRSIDSSLIPAIDGMAEQTHFSSGPPGNTSHNDAIPTIAARAEEFVDETRHLCQISWRRYHHRAGIINRSLLLHAIFVAQRMEYPVALDILAAASADESGAPDERMNSVLRLWVEDSPRDPGLSGPKTCIWALPFHSMAESCYYLGSNSRYVEDWRDGIEIEGTPAVPPAEEPVSEASMEQG